MIKISVFDDSPGRQEAIKLLIEEQQDMQLLAIYENCAYLVDNISLLIPDVVLMDIDMPVVNGIEGVKLIRENFPGVVIIMQTVFEDENSIFKAIQAGAHGYILKSARPAKLIEAIRDSLEGGAPMTPVIAKKVLENFRKQPIEAGPGFPQLTAKENEILAALEKGLSYKMIASELDISWHTVNSHVKKIYEKLHVHSATEAINKIRKHRDR
ncbi:MAG: response regulator transcription factor [Ferruginibacter sp.]